MKLKTILGITTIWLLIFLGQASGSDGAPPFSPRGESSLGSPHCGVEPCCPTGSPAWSINMVNMNLFVHDIPSWYNPAVGPNVEIRLSYNSAAGTSGYELFGNKWTFGYNGYLENDGNGNITVTMPDGRRDVFVSDGSGGYIQPYQVYSTLVKNTDTNFELHFRSGKVYVFNHDASGLQKIFLTEIRDPRGHSLTFGYTGDLLTTVTDAQGAVTTLFYNGNNLVYRVEDPFGRASLFEYDTNRNLIKIDDMGGYSTQVEYDTGGSLVALINGAGRTEFFTEPADQTGGTPQVYPLPGADMNESYRITVILPEGGKEEYFYNSVGGGI